jgi:hypothetical protein
LRESAKLFDRCFSPVSFLFFGVLPKGSNCNGSPISIRLFFGQSAWHGLGVTLPEDSPARYSIDDSIKIAGLDWRVESRGRSSWATVKKLRGTARLFAAIKDSVWALSAIATARCKSRPF